MEDVKDNKPLEDAMSAFDLLFKDDEESERAVRRMIAEMDKKAYIATGLEKGMEKGIKQGIRQGKKQGKKEAQIEAAKRMLAKGIDIETIIECTELTKEEIEKIKENK